MKQEMPEAPEKNESKKIDDYEVNSAMETLMRAEEIKKDPELMKLVQKKAGSKMKSIKSVQDLRDLGNDMDDDEDEDD